MGSPFLFNQGCLGRTCDFILSLSGRTWAWGARQLLFHVLYQGILQLVDGMPLCLVYPNTCNSG